MVSSQVESKKPKLRNFCSSVEKLTGKMEVGRNLYCMSQSGAWEAVWMRVWICGICFRFSGFVLRVATRTTCTFVGGGHPQAFAGTLVPLFTVLLSNTSYPIRSISTRDGTFYVRNACRWRIGPDWDWPPKSIAKYYNERIKLNEICKGDGRS